MEATGKFRALVEGDANTRFFQTYKSVTEAAALDEGLATARRSDPGLQSGRRQQRFHHGNLSALRQDLGYHGP